MVISNLQYSMIEQKQLKAIVAVNSAVKNIPIGRANTRASCIKLNPA